MTIHEFKIKFPSFWATWQNTHKQANRASKGHRGHGTDHDLMVLGYCLLLAGNNQYLAEMSGCAALLHSFDRLGAAKKINPIAQTLVDYFNSKNVVEILLAVRRHNKPNTNDDLPTQIILQDADRLSNMGPILIARAGQFRPHIPVIEMEYLGFEKNPKSTYKKPVTINDNIKSSLEWETDSLFYLRTPKAKQLAKKYFKFLKQYILLNELQHKEAGLI